MDICHACNNLGKEGGCPRCGRTPRTSTIEKLNFNSIDADIIPTVYQGKLWEKPENTEKVLRFKQFDEALEKVYKTFLQGSIPKFSMFIGAPPKTGKNLFAYACMQTALMQKYSVSPLLSTADWRRLQRVSQMNPFYKLFKKYQWDDLIARDVVFLYIEHSDEHNTDIPLLKSIYDTRASFDKSTFVISDYRLNDLVPKWGKDAFSDIYNSDKNRDYLRYPVIIHRFE